MTSMSINTTQKQDTASEASNTNYSELLQLISSQLKSRQSLIWKRVAKVSLPLAICAGIALSLTRLDSAPAWAWAAVGVATLLTFFWALITGFVFKIERVIWVDSFFDKNLINEGNSWAAAKRLFKQGVWLNILVIFRYYLPVTVLFLAVFAALMISNDPQESDLTAFLLMVIIYPIFMFLYSYYVKFRLRYVWFLFVDTFGTPDFSYRNLFKESKILNRAVKSDEFSKLLVTYFGTDVASAAAESIVGIMKGSLPGGNSAAGTVVAQYASEVIAVNRSYAQLVTFYVFYRLGRQAVYGQAQVTNSHLFSTAN